MTAAACTRKTLIRVFLKSFSHKHFHIQLLPRYFGSSLHVWLLVLPKLCVANLCLLGLGLSLWEAARITKAFVFLLLQ